MDYFKVIFKLILIMGLFNISDYLSELGYQFIGFLVALPAIYMVLTAFMFYEKKKHILKELEKLKTKLEDL